MAGSFDPLLYERAQLFWTAAKEDGVAEFLEGPLVELGESFLEPYRPEPPLIAPVGKGFQPYRWEAALAQAASELPQVSSILWRTIAALGARPDPETETSILNVQEHLPYAWGICDAALHAMGKAYALNFHVQERLKEWTGHIFIHGCGCDHYLRGVLMQFCRFPLIPDDRPDLRAKAAKEWLDHFLSELRLIFVDGLPFRLNPEGAESQRVVAVRPVAAS